MIEQYNPQEVIHTKFDENLTPAERAVAYAEDVEEHKICDMVGRELVKYYGGWQWYVDCHLRGGVVYVRNLSLSGVYGFVLHLDKLLNETDPKMVMMAGGELLERYYQARGAKPSSYDIKRDITGEAIGDVSDASS